MAAAPKTSASKAGSAKTVSGKTAAPKAVSTKPAVAKTAAAAPVKTRSPKFAPSVGDTVVVRQVSSPIRRTNDQRATLRGLGLDRIGRVSELKDTPSVRGMIHKVRHMVVVEKEG